MNTATDMARIRQDQYGLRLAARLGASADDLPRDIGERLRAARMQALARRKCEPISVRTVSVSAGQAVLGGTGGLSLWQRLASALPLIVLVAGLVTIHVVQNEHRARELAEVDAALLTDDLPPAAYADPGFVQFLKTER